MEGSKPATRERRRVEGCRDKRFLVGKEARTEGNRCRLLFVNFFFLFRLPYPFF
jgi:hypothetical protein